MKDFFAYVDTHREEAVGFLQKLISFDTTFQDQGVQGNEGEAQRWLCEQLDRWGFETVLQEPDNEKISCLPDFNPGHQYEGRPNLIAVHRGKGGGKSILLNGHMDTVPLDDLDKWTCHPLGGKVIDGKIFGRGACDMKAGLAAMILAVKYLNDYGLTHAGDILVESVVDEEGGGNGTLACVAEGYRADVAVVTEPTSLEIYCASRGVYLLELEVEGRPSHACFKWKGVNAIEKGMQIASALKELEREWLAVRHNPYLPSPTITLGEIQGGISAATVPGTCILRFDIKYLPYEIDEQGRRKEVDGEAVKKEVEAYIDQVCAGDPWLKEHPVKKNWYLSVMPHFIDTEHPILALTGQAGERVLGTKPRISGLPSGADARHLQNTGKIPTILFGPGDMHNAHSIDEWVSEEDYISAIKILADMIYHWTNEGENE